MWHKGVRWHRVESDILKEGPGTKIQLIQLMMIIFKIDISLVK